MPTEKPQEHKEIVFDDIINTFDYAGPPKSSENSPLTPVQNCSMRLFERTVTKVDVNIQRKIFDELRLIVVTPPEIKTLSSISRIFEKGVPTLCSNLRAETDTLAPIFAIRDESEKTSLKLTFKSVKKRADLHTLMVAVSTRPDEQSSSAIPLENMYSRSVWAIYPTTIESVPVQFDSLENCEGHQSRTDRQHYTKALFRSIDDVFNLHTENRSRSG